MKTICNARRLVWLAIGLISWSRVWADPVPTLRKWTVDGVVRQALIYAPAEAKTTATPVVFAFHGHGGTMNQAALKFDIHTHWPAAIVAYLQGLPGPGHLVDPVGQRSGWQIAVGDQGDRDLKFFDAAWATLHQEYRIDDKRVYATGHSNGGYFTYLLWAARGDRFAAVAPVAATAGRLMVDLKPKPVLHIAGQNDPLVKFAWQQTTMDRLRKRNGCGEGQPWGDNPWCTLYPGNNGTPVVTCIHPGKHEFPAAAAELIVRFFKEHAQL